MVNTFFSLRAKLVRMLYGQSILTRGTLKNILPQGKILYKSFIYKSTSLNIILVKIIWYVFISSANQLC